MIFKTIMNDKSGWFHSSILLTGYVRVSLTGPYCQSLSLASSHNIKQLEELISATPMDEMLTVHYRVTRQQ